MVLWGAMSYKADFENQEIQDPKEKIQAIFFHAKTPVREYLYSPKCLCGLIRSEFLRKAWPHMGTHGNLISDSWKDTIYFATSISQVKERMQIMAYAFDPRLKDIVTDEWVTFQEVALTYANNATWANSSSLKKFQKKYKSLIKKKKLKRNNVNFEKSLYYGQLQGQYSENERNDRYDNPRNSGFDARKYSAYLREGSIEESWTLLFNYIFSLATKLRTQAWERINKATVEFKSLDSKWWEYLAWSTKWGVVNINNAFKNKQWNEVEYTNELIAERSSYLSEVAIHELFHVAGLWEHDNAVSIRRLSKQYEANTNSSQKNLYIKMKELEITAKYSWIEMTPSLLVTREQQLQQIKEYANYIFEREEYDTRMKWLREFFPDRFHEAWWEEISEYLKDIEEKSAQWELSNAMKYKYEAHRLFIKIIDFDGALIKKYRNEMVYDDGVSQDNKVYW